MAMECDTPGLAPATTDLRRGGIYRRGGKRALDLCLVLLAAPAILIVLLPLMIAVACDGGSPFYTQLRVGQGGRLYRMWKLRSMQPDADRLLAEHLAANAEARAEWEHSQKLSHDPRITAVGRIIRKTSMDELPQLWNVLRGDMSLVGPRPMMDSQRALYQGRAYYRLRPGVTGLWQVAARNQSSFAARASFDTLYHRRLSLRQDLALLAATVAVVCRCTGR
ncbi:sugar transferase [Citreicella sp. C3M06]|uniref:sugar transferase n=1 Tax=Citreicella sp. C3M06 TaxID=2841564 RepID=UPI001C09EF03|nr:sugar transferase [Citreicella sp. C3M06]MBU2960055.1 sugar transferase [Citreicella sp. C3M06]